MILCGLPREDDSPMSRRDLSQPSFVDAMVSGCGKGGGFLNRIEKAFDWPAFEALLAPIHASTRGAPGYPPVTMFKVLRTQMDELGVTPDHRIRALSDLPNLVVQYP